MNYKWTNFDLKNLRGLSDRQIIEHLKLYSGYVKNSNELIEKIEKLNFKISPDNYILAKLRRRLGFEFNGMRLHELYFESLAGNEERKESALLSLMEKQF